jgi:protein gp37
VGDETKIEWTDATWNPIRGCSRVSPGCENCYAERTAARFSGEGLAYEGLATISKNGPRWTGEVRLIPEHVTDPIRWTRPRRIFVNSMSDLFHEKLTDGTIALIFAVMAMAPQHTFQVLTKRPKRMARWFDGAEPLVAGEIKALALAGKLGERWKQGALPELPAWPLPNVWLGTTVEDQERANERIPHLLSTPAAVRFLSCEPLLGPVDLNRVDFTKAGWRAVNGFPEPTAESAFARWQNRPMRAKLRNGVDWVIVGGESGPGARPCAEEWITDVVKQCKAARVPVFVKQLGAYVVSVERTAPASMFKNPERFKPEHFAPNGEVWAWSANLESPKGGDPTEWPKHLRVREMPEVAP